MRITTPHKRRARHPRGKRLISRQSKQKMPEVSATNQTLSGQSANHQHPLEPTRIVKFQIRQRKQEPRRRVPLLQSNQQTDTSRTKKEILRTFHSFPPPMGPACKWMTQTARKAQCHNVSRTIKISQASVPTCKKMFEDCGFSANTQADDDDPGLQVVKPLEGK